MRAAGARGPLAIATVLLLATSVSTFHEPASAGSYSRQNKQESNAEFSSPFNDHYKGRETWTATGNSPIEMDEVQGKELRIFCWEGLPLDIRRLWYTAYFLLDIKDDSFHLYKGVTTQEVKDQYKSSSRFFAFLPWKDRNVRLNCFSPTCLGVYTNKSYTLTLSVNPVDPLRLGMFIAGVILVLFARKMSRNSVFHYGSGISVALLGSLLVVIFLVSRMIPRKAFGASFLIGGWAMVLYFLRTMWTNFRETLLQHRNYVATYVTLVSGLTFLLIYRFGGVRNPRTMDILQWIMQFLGTVDMFSI
jgi:NEMP family